MIGQFLERGTTVGELTQLLLDYCDQKLKGETDEQLFTVLLQS